jgi:hypothetical protein
MTTSNVLAATRAAIGVSCWATPVFASKLFGVDISGDVSGNMYLRLGGTRDLALAAGTAGMEGESKSLMLKIAAGCDVGDIVAVAIARRSGKISRLGSVLFYGASLGCLALGAKSLSEA